MTGVPPSPARSLDSTSAAGELLGREYLRDEDDWCLIRYRGRPEFNNRNGTLQGGMLAAMLDSATGYAVVRRLPAGQFAVTTRLDTHFLRPARAGDLIARVRLVSITASQASVEGRLIDPQGVDVARCTAELRILERRPPS